MAESSEPPVVLLHRPPSLTFMDEILTREFRTLITDTSSSESLPSFFPRHASSARAFVISGRLPVTDELLSHLPSLQILVCTSVGIDHIDLAACKRRGIVITNAGNAFSDDVADCAVGLLISVLRRIPAADRYVRAGNWAKFGDFQLGSKVSGKRVGIVGLGSIGSFVAKRLESFGCVISYNSRSQKQSSPYRYYSDILSLAENNDVLVLCCSLTDETHHIVNREVMESLGKDGVVINVGRGKLIDEKEMVKCLVEGVIGGAGLDVFENEPAVPEELFGLDNVVLSPHFAVATPGSLDNVAQIALANLKAFFSNRPLLSPVQLD
ncbi:Glyoxylate/hydroxypyruvate reductase HPR3 [Arabidopsis thaliana]|uniref:HPR3 n=2 Tax=Arabidopsis TaxID=3701 RepID=A0A178WMD4_ARATH|nr:NAD(P)-binding domain superfamily [Arabidopsis thaliana x Arabidopsis arenosa]OAP19439.1 HPR3 [Arabidopsis thaliana]